MKNHESKQIILNTLYCDPNPRIKIRKNKKKMKINRESRNIAFLGFGFMMIYTSVLTSRARHDHVNDNEF